MERKKRSDIMLCYPLEKRRLLEPKFNWSFPVLCQPKLDGIRCRAICEGPNVILLSSTCSVITSVPHVNEALEALCLNCELDGELYVHGETFEHISSVTSRTTNVHEDASNMQFFIFDHINLSSQLERLVSLRHLIPPGNPILRLVPIKTADSFTEIIQIYEQFLASGYEGIIVRHRLALYERKRSRFVLKFKPKKNDVYEIVSYTQMQDKHGDLKPLLGALLCTSDEGTTFSVGSGMTETFRQDAWKNPSELIGRFCKISYQHITAKGAPRFPIFVSVLDINPEETEPDITGGIL